MKGLPSQLANYKISQGKMKHTDKNSTSEFVIKIGNNLNQIAVLESAELQEKWTEIEKIAIKKPAPPKPKPVEKPAEKPAEGGETKEGTEDKKAEGEEEKKDEKPPPEPETV